MTAITDARDFRVTLTEATCVVADYAELVARQMVGIVLLIFVHK